MASWADYGKNVWNGISDASEKIGKEGSKIWNGGADIVTGGASGLWNTAKSAVPHAGYDTSSFKDAINGFGNALNGVGGIVEGTGGIGGEFLRGTGKLLENAIKFPKFGEGVEEAKPQAQAKGEYPDVKKIVSDMEAGLDKGDSISQPQPQPQQKPRSWVGDTKEKVAKDLEDSFLLGNGGFRVGTAVGLLNKGKNIQDAIDEAREKGVQSVEGNTGGDTITKISGSVNPKTGERSVTKESVTYDRNVVPGIGKVDSAVRDSIGAANVATHGKMEEGGDAALKSAEEAYKNGKIGYRDLINIRNAYGYKAPETYKDFDLDTKEGRVGYYSSKGFKPVERDGKTLYYDPGKETTDANGNVTRGSGRYFDPETGEMTMVGAPVDNTNPAAKRLIISEVLGQPARFASRLINSKIMEGKGESPEELADYLLDPTQGNTEDQMEFQGWDANSVPEAVLKGGAMSLAHFLKDPYNYLQLLTVGQGVKDAGQARKALEYADKARRATAAADAAKTELDDLVREVGNRATAADRTAGNAGRFAKAAAEAKGVGGGAGQAIKDAAQGSIDEAAEIAANSAANAAKRVKTAENAAKIAKSNVGKYWKSEALSTIPESVSEYSDSARDEEAATAKDTAATEEAYSNKIKSLADIDGTAVNKIKQAINADGKILVTDRTYFLKLANDLLRQGKISSEDLDRAYEEIMFK